MLYRTMLGLRGTCYDIVYSNHVPRIRLFIYWMNSKAKSVVKSVTLTKIFITRVLRNILNILTMVKIMVKTWKLIFFDLQ